MFEPNIPETKHTRIRTEREYREWQMALAHNVPGKRSKNEPGIFTRLASTIRRVAAL